MTRHFLELVRYGINGIAATAVHFSVLTFNLQVLHLASAGLANVIAALFGIIVSFFGSRYFVFPGGADPIHVQALRFGGMYGTIAALHGAVLFVWTDVYALDYRIGFLVATAMQVAFSYLGNKFLVFKA